MQKNLKIVNEDLSSSNHNNFSNNNNNISSVS